MSSVLPTAPTDEIYPTYRDLENNWRAVDVHWLRDRAVMIFDDGAERDGLTGIGANARQGMVTYLKATGTTDPALEPSGLYVRNAAAWESVRYPNLNVTSDSTSITLRRTGAGSGVVLRTNGTVDIATLFAGTGTDPATRLGTVLDNTGISLRVGTRTVKLSTSATALTIDSPVTAMGDVTSTTMLRAPAADITGNITAVNSTLSGTLTVSAVAAGGMTATAGTVAAVLLRASNDADLTVDSGLAVFRHRNSPVNRLSFSSTGAAVLTGSTVTVNGAITAVNAATFQGATTFRLVPQINLPGVTAAPVAGVVATNRAPTGSDNYANGTIWFHI